MFSPSLSAFLCWRFVWNWPSARERHRARRRWPQGLDHFILHTLQVMLFGAPSIRLVERPWRENKGVPTMTEFIHELGPVGWLVIEFPGSGFDSEIPLTISAACLVGQNRWTRRTASAISRAGGQLVVNGRIRCRHCSLQSRPTPPQWSLKKEFDMPLATRRMARASVNGPAPVPRTATTVATAAVVESSMTDRFLDEIETRA